ncbi:MAG: hypothetical protein F6K04_00815 [Leptolyngbya sp. SIO4C5]|nr:hypothetical protein [Leptolyngbya sp. SIO4C5]
MQGKPRPKKLLDRVGDAVRLKHYSYRTEQTYVQWIRCYILFHDKRHPQEMGVPEIEAFLTHPAVQEQVAASTQNQAFILTRGTRREKPFRCIALHHC